MHSENKVGSNALLVLPFLFLSSVVMAQQWTPNFKHYGIRDGLPSSEVYQITSDPQKNLWFVTDRGVVRYDGTVFRVFDKKDTLPENSVIKVYKDRKGRVWFISYTGLLSYYENGKIIPYRYNTVITQNLGTIIFTSLYVDENEAVYINGISGNLFKIDSSGKFSNIDPVSDTTSFTITVRESVSPSTFLHHVEHIDVTHFKIQFPNDTFDLLINEKIGYSHFSSAKLSNSDLVFYCGRTLIHFRKDKSFIIKHFESPILNVFEDYEKHLWIGCHNDGVYVYDSSLKKISHYFTDLSVSHVFGDYEGGLWFSTLENGIFYLPSKHSLIFAVQENILQEKINAVAGIQDSILFFATSKGTLYKLNSGKKTLLKKNLKQEIPLPLQTINSLYCIEPENELMVAFEPNSRVNASSTVWDGTKIIGLYSCTRFIPQDKNNLLGSEYQFVYSYNPKSLTKNYMNKESFHSTALFKDSKGRLFAGSLNNLSIYSDSNFIAFDSTNKAFRKRITDIQELDSKYLVVATRSDGIILYSDSVVGVINSLHGLSSDNINRIIVEPGRIWASTNRGLNKIIITNYAPFTFRIQHYNISSGLPSDEINDFAISNNNIYVATNEGLILIKEKKQSDSYEEIPVYVNSIKINDQDTSVLASYSLNHKQNTINITFAAVSFRYSKNISYLYRLHGLDTTWRTTVNRDVQFTNLPPGKYKFQLLAQGGEDVFSKAPIEVEFDISQPFYQSIWFRLLAAFIFWMVLFAAISLRIRAIKKKAEVHNELNRKFSELNLNALRSQMNPHFTFNVLNSIQYYIAKKDSESAQLYITKFARLIRMILDQSRTEFISLAEEIRILTLYIELEELRFEKKFSYTINVDAQLNTSSIYIPGMLIQPFVENSIKHGIRFKKGEAHVDIDFRASDSILICMITDNGIGRDEAAKLKSGNGEFKSVGTDIVHERIEALSIAFKGKLKNYTTDLTDEYGKPAGTRVTVEVPFKTIQD